MQQILTANRLRPGEVVYWNRAGGWVAAFERADVLPTSEAEGALEAASESVRRREVVNPYLFAVNVEGRVVTPAKAREIIRSAGPSVRRDLGKQAYGS